MTITVKEIMSKPVVTIDEGKSAMEAGKLMKKVRKGILVVTRGEEKTPVGILSDSDLINKIIAKDLKASDVKIKDIMSRTIISVSPEADITTAVDKIKKSNIHRLPVISNGKLVGIISLTDIARASPEMFYLLEYRLKMKEKPFRIEETTTSGICDLCDNYSNNLRMVNGKWLCESCRDEEEK